MKNVRLSVNLCNTNINVTAEYAGVDINCNWNYADRPKYIMTVRNTDNGKKFTATFWGSLNDLQTCKTDVSEDLLVNMLYCIIMDAQAGDMSFHNFCNELGYELLDAKSKRIYNGCVKTKEKFESIFDEPVDLVDIYNEFTENFDI